MTSVKNFGGIKMHLQVFHILSLLHLTVTENAHRSQNRLESYHTLRSAIAKVSGRKALLGRTDLEIEISNQGSYYCMYAQINHYTQNTLERKIYRTTITQLLPVLLSFSSGK